MEVASQEVMELIERNRGTVRDDDKLYVRFYEFAEYQKRPSEGYLNEKGETVPGAGRKVFENKVYVEIIPPGDGAHNVINRAVRESDKGRWPKQWERFKAGSKPRLGCWHSH